jgi:acetyl-CoA carboxylase carboxyl transferase subunit beta
VTYVFGMKNDSNLSARLGQASTGNWISKTPGLKQNSGNLEETPFRAPEGYWMRCDGCSAILTKEVVEKNLRVCTECGHHFRMGAHRRIAEIFDPQSFQEFDMGLSPKNPLGFFDTKSYPDRIQASQKKTELKEAFVSGSALLDKRPVEVGAFEFSFMGGSMGTVVGEKIARLFDRAYEHKRPAVIFQASGGARMQEGILSLMQMAKTTVALTRLKEKGIPYISVMTDPTTGGVAASFAMLGDLNIAEPDALIGFAGPRVISQTINQKLPDDFQRAEFLLKHGMLDAVVPRKELRSYLSRVIKFLMD